MLTRIIRALAPSAFKSSSLAPLSLKIAEGWGGTPTTSGAIVNEHTALRVAAALCATRVIAEGVAQMPLTVLALSREGGRERAAPASDDPTWNLLNREPNGWQTSFEFRELLTMHAAVTGAGRALITRGETGKIQELLPLEPAWVSVERADDLSARYTVNIPRVGVIRDLDRQSILDVRGPSWTGIAALNIAQEMREALGLAMTIERASADAHNKSQLPAGVLTTENAVSADVVDALREHWRSRYGVGGDGGVTVLDNNWSFKAMGYSPVDNETLESRRFQIEEIARAFRVSPLMLMQSDKASTYASAESFFLAHVVHTLGPWVERWEQSLDLSLFKDQRDRRAHHQTEGLLRGSFSDRSEYYARALGSGGHHPWMTPNDVRAREGLPPVAGGDEFALPTNMQTAAPADQKEPA